MFLFAKSREQAIKFINLMETELHKINMSLNISKCRAILLIGGEIITAQPAL
jgi:hypothetical protein